MKAYYRDRLRGYRLGRQARAFLASDWPERFSFYLSGNTDTNRVKSEVSRRLRLHRIAESYALMKQAEVAVFRDEKPHIFAPAPACGLQVSVPAFYGSREIKEMGTETVKIRGSRMTGVLLTPSEIFVIYNGGSGMMRWDHRAEQRTQVLLKIIICNQRLPFQYAGAGVSGILFGHGLEALSRILSERDSGSRCFFLLDGNYEHFYYLTNDERGELLLRLLCSPEKKAELDGILSQGLCERDSGLPVENDAVDEAGAPVLFAYLPDIPRIGRFCTALQLQERKGTVICFDFQKEVFARLCGGWAGLSTISFEKWKRRFFS